MSAVECLIMRGGEGCSGVIGGWLECSSPGLVAVCKCACRVGGAGGDIVVLGLGRVFARLSSLGWWVRALLVCVCGCSVRWCGWCLAFRSYGGVSLSRADGVCGVCWAGGWTFVHHRGV